MKREERALLLMPEYICGGAETQFRYFLEYADKRRWKIDVIVEHRFKKDDAILKKKLAKMINVRFYELGGESDDRTVLLKIIRHILKNYFRIKYKVCLIYYLPDLINAPYMRMLGIHVIYSERIDAAGIEKSLGLQKCLKFCNQILANSEYGKRKLEHLTGKKVTVIKNGKPPVPMFLMKENRNIRRILVPARITTSKNQMLLLYFLNKYPDFEGKVFFVGTVSDKSYQRKLNQYVCSKGLQGKVVFLGHIEELQEEYKKADLVVLPSFAEGTPNVVLEAYAYGRPVIGSDIGSLQEIITDPKLRFGIKNPEEIYACIKYVEEMSEEMYEQILRKNREYVLKNYDIETMAESYGKILFK